MRNECNIIRDILPLYMENLVSDDTAAFLEDHLKTCAACRAELEQMKAPKDFQVDADIAPLKTLRRKMVAKKIQTIVFTAVLVLAIAVTAFAVLDEPRFFPYSQDLLTVAENSDGSVTVTFNDQVTDYRCNATLEADSDLSIYRIEAWSSFLDTHFSNRGIQSTVIRPTDGRSFAIYYVQNNGDDDVCLYHSGEAEISNAISLPALTLGYYLIFAAILFGLLGMAWLVIKKPEIRIWLFRAILLPISYMIGHVIVCGFTTVTYSVGRDFVIIVFISLLIYCGLLLVYNIYRLSREIKEVPER